MGGAVAERVRAQRILQNTRKKMQIEHRQTALYATFRALTSKRTPSCSCR